MKYRYIFILLVFTGNLQSCKENDQNDDDTTLTGNSIEISMNELKFNKSTATTGNYDKSIEISIGIKNNTSESFIFNFSNVSGRSKASFNPGLKRPGRITELGLIERSNMKKVLQPKDSTTLDLRIQTDLQANTLKEMLDEFSSKFSGKYELYLINLGVNKTFRTEINFARIPKSFYLDSEKVDPKDSLQMKVTALNIK